MQNVLKLFSKHLKHFTCLLFFPQLFTLKVKYSANQTTLELEDDFNLFAFKEDDFKTQVKLLKVQ